MSEYRHGRRRRRSRSGRRGPEQRSEHSHKSAQKSKPQGLLGWLKKLFGLSPRKTQASQDVGSRRGTEHHRNGSSSEQRGQHKSVRGTRRDAGSDAAGEKTQSATSASTSSAPSRRKAELLEVTTPRLYVGNLGYDITESDLFELFSQAAPVKNVEIARDRENERSKGFGFVEFSSVEDARVAQAKLNEYELAGRPLLVSGAKAPTSRRSGPSAGGAIRAAAEKTEGSELIASSTGEGISEDEDSKFNR